MHYKTHNKQTSIPIVLYFIIIFYQKKKIKKRIESWVSRVDQKKGIKSRVNMFLLLTKKFGFK